eukprot:TRINITY_DN11761_c0_g1_i3.p1 TRINITY_DN11761_c0_g1~~TRINITY_DN11761_c0_g1_i3.p1  ORF type:complete len:674 (-),score=123.46 TRINITY_DN11761_c0_g1_i3:42-2063(-)
MAVRSVTWAETTANPPFLNVNRGYVEANVDTLEESKRPADSAAEPGEKNASVCSKAYLIYVIGILFGLYDTVTTVIYVTTDFENEQQLARLRETGGFDDQSDGTWTAIMHSLLALNLLLLIVKTLAGLWYVHAPDRPLHPSLLTLAYGSVPTILRSDIDTRWMEAEDHTTWGLVSIGILELLISDIALLAGQLHWTVEHWYLSPELLQTMIGTAFGLAASGSALLVLMFNINYRWTEKQRLKRRIAIGVVLLAIVALVVPLTMPLEQPEFTPRAIICSKAEDSLWMEAIFTDRVQFVAANIEVRDECAVGSFNKLRQVQGRIVFDGDGNFALGNFPSVTVDSLTFRNTKRALDMSHLTAGVLHVEGCQLDTLDASAAKQIRISNSTLDVRIVHEGSSLTKIEVSNSSVASIVSTGSTKVECQITAGSTIGQLTGSFGSSRVVDSTLDQLESIDPDSSCTGKISDTNTLEVQSSRIDRLAWRGSSATVVGSELQEVEMTPRGCDNETFGAGRLKMIDSAVTGQLSYVAGAQQASMQLSGSSIGGIAMLHRPRSKSTRGDLASAWVEITDSIVSGSTTISGVVLSDMAITNARMADLDVTLDNQLQNLTLSNATLSSGNVFDMPCAVVECFLDRIDGNLSIIRFQNESCAGSASNVSYLPGKLTRVFHVFNHCPC